MTDETIIRSLFLDGPYEFQGRHSRGRISQNPVPATAFIMLTLTCDMVMALVLSVLLEQLFTRAQLSWPAAVSAVLLPMAGIALFGYATQLYKIEMIADFRRYRRHLLRLLPGMLLLLLVAELVLLPLLQPDSDISVPRAAFAIAMWFAGLSVAIFAWRYAAAGLHRYCAQAGLTCHRVVVIGATEAGRNFINTLRQARLGARVVAVFDDAYPPRIGSFAGVPVQGGIGKLLSFHKHYDIDTVVIASKLPADMQNSALVRLLNMQPLRLRVLPDMPAQQAENWCAPWNEVPGVPLLKLTDLPIERCGLIGKMLFDKAAALGALALFGPLMLACAAIIKLTSPGPVFFLQPRIGLRNRTFMVYKFRSMHVNDCGHAVLTTRNDNRVFPFGAIMRKLSLDELPQLFNVLKGDMSMVGPRPHMPQARAAGVLYYDIVPNYAARHRVRPGITGLAQVKGWRGPTETFEQIEQRVRCDLEYIERWSLTLDLKILLRTALVGFFGKNAF